jgi:hypothetical protein
VAEAVLSLVAAARPRPGELPWLAELALPGDDGDWYPAAELLLPGGALDGLVAGDAPFGIVAAETVERWGAETLVAVGVLDGFAVVRDGDVPVDAALAGALGHDLDGEASWHAAVEAVLPDDDAPAVVAELVALRDLELVRDDAWPATLALLARPPLRAAVVEPARVVLAGGRGFDVASYTAWWLGRHPVLDGRLPARWGLGELGGLFDVARTDLDEEFLRAIGVTSSLAAAVGADPAEVLTRLADASRDVRREVVREAYALLADADPERFAPPDRVRAATSDGSLAVVDAATVVVVDAPDLLPLLAGRPVVPAPLAAADRLADALALPLAGELADYGVRSVARARADWAALPGADLAGRRAGGLPSTVVAVHDELVVDDVKGDPATVRWRSLPDVDHVVADDPGALGRALAWRLRAWASRAALTEAFAAGSAGVPLLAAEDDLDAGLPDRLDQPEEGP